VNTNSEKILAHLKALLIDQVPLHQLILFGSRARGDNAADSDMDVLVVLDAPVTPTYRDIVLDCAWEAGFDADVVIMPVVVSHDAWEKGPEYESLLARVIRKEGIAV
jgi:uncharacterized protein